MSKSKFSFCICLAIWNIYALSSEVNCALNDKQLQTSIIENVLNEVVQPPRFTEPPEANHLSVEKLVEIIQPIITDRLINTNYDRIQVALQLINQHKQDVGKDGLLTPLQSLRNFRYDASLFSKGAPCVGLTLDILNHLPKFLNAYVVAAELPRHYQQFAAPKYCHTAVLVPYQSDDDFGYILLDPSFDFAEPIIVKKNSNFVYDGGLKGIWTFFLENNKIVAQISSTPTTEWSEKDIYEKRMYYRIDVLSNPIESSAVPMVLADRKLSLLARNENGIQNSQISIELDKHRVVWSENGVRKSPISFKDFLDEKFQFDDSFSKPLGMISEELNNMVLILLKNAEILDLFYIDYLNLLLKTEDWSITGSLDKEKINEVIENTRKGLSCE